MKTNAKHEKKREAFDFACESTFLETENKGSQIIGRLAEIQVRQAATIKKLVTMLNDGGKK